MFTGIVTEKGAVVSIKEQGGGARLAVRAAVPDAATGDSISINGACLTVTEIKGDVFGFDVSGETLGSTTLGALRPGDKVNIEPALSAGARMGGHFVTGHVDCVGTIRKKTGQGSAFKMEIAIPERVTTAET